MEKIVKLFGFSEKQNKFPKHSRVFNEFWDNIKTKPKRTKGYFYDNIDIMKNFKTDLDFNSLKSEAFKEAFSKYDQLMEIENEENVKPENEDTKMVILNIFKSVI